MNFFERFSAAVGTTAAFFLRKKHFDSIKVPKNCSSPKTMSFLKPFLKPLLKPYFLHHCAPQKECAMTYIISCQQVQL